MNIVNIVNIIYFKNSLKELKYNTEARVAQSVERWSYEPKVASSILAVSIFYTF